MKRQIICKTVLIFLAFLLLIPPAAATAAPIEAAAAAPSITARAAIVIDFETGDVLFARDPDTRRPPASMTKIMTAFIVYEEIAAGRLSLDSMVYISNHASHFHRNRWPGHIILPAGSRQSVENLLRLIMLPSHNGACIAVAEHIAGSEAAFVRRMNDTAQELGMNASYENAHGLWGNSKSPRATAVLTQAFIERYPDILRITSMRFFSFNGVAANNTNDALAHAHIDGFKTGTTGAAGPCLSSTASRDGRRVISVTMNSSSHSTRFSDSVRLLDFGLAELARRDGLAQAITVDVTADTAAPRRNTDIRFTARLENVNTGNMSALGGGWRVNGEPVSSFGRFTPANQRSFSISYFLPGDSDLEALDIAFYIDLPGGVRRTGALALAVSPEAPALFRDISGHWAEGQIERAVEQGLFAGLPGGFFEPDGNMTRAMFVTVLGRMAQGMGINIASGAVPGFRDVPAGEWFSRYVSWAWEQGIAQGVSAEWFGADNAVTRQEVATLLYRFMQRYAITLPGGTHISFPDAYQVDNWAQAAMAEAVRSGLITGLGDGRLAPTETATRAQVAVIFLRFTDAYSALPDVDFEETEPEAEEEPGSEPESEVEAEAEPEEPLDLDPEAA